MCITALTLYIVYILYISTVCIYLQELMMSYYYYLQQLKLVAINSTPSMMSDLFLFIASRPYTYLHLVLSHWCIYYIIIYIALLIMMSLTLMS